MNWNIPYGGSSFLSVLIWLPFFGACLLFFVPKGNRASAKGLAQYISFVTLVLSICLLARFDVNNHGFQMTQRLEWMPQLGIEYALGVDGLSIYFLVLTALLTFLVTVAADSIHERLSAYLGFVLFLETGMLGTFLALDGVLFYVFWELMLIPMYFLIGVWGHGRKVYAALKFFLYTALGSLLMLVAICTLAYLCSADPNIGRFSFSFGDWERLQFSSRTELWLFAAFALAFAIKIPMFPLHTWLPDAHVEAPTGGSVILAGVLLKMGLYGLIRICVPVFPYATYSALPLFALLGVIGIVFGALVAWVQTDMKKLVAYSSVSHLGFCVLGFSCISIYGMQGCILQMLNHGVSTAALFFLVGVLYDRKHTRQISDYGGIAVKMPVYAALFLVFTLSSIGLPLTNGFVGEFLILLGSFSFSPVLCTFAVTGVIFGAMYMLSMYRRVFFGSFDETRNGDLQDLTVTEKFVFAPLVILVFVMGVYPQPILRALEPASQLAVSMIERNRQDLGSSHFFAGLEHERKR